MDKTVESLYCTILYTYANAALYVNYSGIIIKNLI